MGEKVNVRKIKSIKCYVLGKVTVKEEDSVRKEEGTTTFIQVVNANNIFLIVFPLNYLFYKVF